MWRRRGFTLLEVMVAVAILGLGLTVILSSQAGLFSTVRRVQKETFATNLARCKMSEVEVELVEDGYPIIDQRDDGECCEDYGRTDFTCEWKIESIELPQPATFAEDPEDAIEDAEEDSGLEGDALGAGGPLGALSQIEQTDGAALGENPDPTDVASFMGGESPAGGGGLISMAMGLVYPDLKPMLEASIRKVTVSVKWQEGRKIRDFTIIQYITNPREGSLNPNAADAVEALMNQSGPAGTESGAAQGPQPPDGGGR